MTLTAGESAVTEALAFVTACLVDSSCVLDSDGHRVNADKDGADEDAPGDAGAHIGLKLALALAMIAQTVLSSYVPYFSSKWDTLHEVRPLLGDIWLV